MEKMRVLGSYGVVYIAAGGGEYADARGTRRRVGEGDLIWLFPEVAHAYGPARDGRWDEVYLLFAGPVFDLWRHCGVIGPDEPVWRLLPVPFWLERIAALARPAAGADGAFLQVARLQALLAEMRAASRAGAGADDWLARACRLLEAQESGSPGLPAVAREAGMSYETFRKRFSTRMGLAPAAYRQARRIERACFLLMDPGATNKAVAERLGFCDEFHFAKAFSRRMGLSPRAFRRQALGTV